MCDKANVRSTAKTANLKLRAKVDIPQTARALLGHYIQSQAARRLSQGHYEFIVRPSSQSQRGTEGWVDVNLRIDGKRIKEEGVLLDWVWALY